MMEMKRGGGAPAPKPKPKPRPKRPESGPVLQPPKSEEQSDRETLKS